MHVTKNKTACSNTLESLNRAIELNPKEKKSYCNRAQVYVNLKQFSEAINDYTRALHVEPTCAETHLALAKLYETTGNIESALFECLYVFYLNSQQPVSSHFFLAGLFVRLGQKKPAARAFENALALSPNDMNSLINLGSIYYHMGLTDKSIEIFRKALTLNAQCGTAYLLLASALTKKALFKEADFAYEKAFELLPEMKALVYNSRSAHKNNQNNLQDALQDVNNALKLDPNLHMAYVNRGMLLLKMGKYREGWKDYQTRYVDSKWKSVAHKPLWQGENLTHRRLFVRCDEGNGDSFQMARYLPLLKQQGAKIILGAPASLIRFFKTLPQLGVDEWVGESEIPSEFDYWISIMSLPYRFQTELDTIPSLKPAWQFTSSAQRRLPKNDNNFRVGLVWGGNSEHTNNENRSMSLSHFEPLLSNTKISFYSLQCGAHSQDIQTLGLDDRLVNLEPKIKNWKDTAEFLLELDLLITVDTGIAHLSASLEKPTWIMLPFCPDYRWLLDRSDSPWYPSVRLFRQAHPKDWESVIVAIKNEISF